MANLYITEYAHPGQVGLAVNTHMALEPAVAEQKIAFTTAAQSAAFGATTTVVRIQSDTAGHVKFGTNPTATASHQPIAADVEYWRAVQPGDKVSAYDGSS